MSEADRRVVESLRRSADAHDQAAALFERLQRPCRAAQHRADAAEARARARRLEARTSQQDP